MTPSSQAPGSPARAKRPGLSVYNSEDGTSLVQVDPNITADDLTSGLVRFVPAGSRLAEIDQPGDDGPWILRFTPQR